MNSSTVGWVRALCLPEPSCKKALARSSFLNLQPALSREREGAHTASPCAQIYSHRFFSTYRFQVPSRRSITGAGGSTFSMSLMRLGR
jgi:hypothetical protein